MAQFEAAASRRRPLALVVRGLACLLGVSGAALGAETTAADAAALRTVGEASVVARDCGSVPGWFHLRRIRLPADLSSWPAYTALDEHRATSAGHCIPVFMATTEPALPYLVQLVLRKGDAPASLYAVPSDLWTQAQQPLQAWQGLESRAVTLPAPAASCRVALLDLQGRTVAYMVDGALLVELDGEWLRLEAVEAAAGRQTFGGQRRVGLVVVDHRVVVEGLSEGVKQGTRASVSLSYDASTLSYPDAKHVRSTGRLFLKNGCTEGTAKRSAFESLLYWLKH
jgi:hypothetical protein